MFRIAERREGATGSGIAWPLACSAAAHLALAGALLLAGAAGGSGRRGAAVVTVDLVVVEPGTGGVPATATRPSGLPELQVPGRNIVSPRIDGRPATAALAPVEAAEAAREPAAPVPASRLTETIVPLAMAGNPAVSAADGPAAVAGAATPDGPRGSATVPGGGGAPEGETAGAAPGPSPRDDEREGESGRGGGRGRVGLLRERIQSRIVYPEEAVRRGIEGDVLLRIRIESGGNPGEIRVSRSSGARLLDDAARRGVARAAPLPASPGWVEVPVRFRLR